MKDSRTKLAGAALFAALIVISAWLLLLGWMALHTDTTELIWSRLFVLLGSLEAVAFGAAGALFGNTIQRQRVKDAQEQANKAEERASSAQNDAKNNAQAAANGK